MSELDQKIESAKARVEELTQELAAVDTELSTLEDRKKALHIRRNALLGDYNNYGEIKKATTALAKLEFSKFPVYSKGRWEELSRVTGVTTKFVLVGEYDHVVEYRREDGMEKGSRKYGREIDVPKALSIWEEFEKGKA